jgi:hypothetical protein
VPKGDLVAGDVRAQHGADDTTICGYHRCGQTHFAPTSALPDQLSGEKEAGSRRPKRDNNTLPRFLGQCHHNNFVAAKHSCALIHNTILVSRRMDDHLLALAPTSTNRLKVSPTKSMGKSQYRASEVEG